MDLKQIANHFKIHGDVSSIKPFGGGHINDTYLIKTGDDADPNYLLQKVNHLVFKDIKGLMRNISVVTEEIRKKLQKASVEDIDRRSLKLIPTKNGKTYIEADGAYWRIFNFIEEHKVFDKAPNAETAYESALMFGQFLTQLSDINPVQLVDTIPNFHNIEYRFKNFNKAVEEDICNRVRLVKEEINYVQSSRKIMRVIHDLGTKQLIPLRIVHNDTKINNVLFDRDNKGLCVIDLDTVMPGFVHYDFGDGVRTCANTGDEDEEDLKNVRYDLKMFEAFASGYTDSVHYILNHAETASLAHAALLFPFIMGLRFLTDYISGDVYYKIKHEEHNLVRAKAQFKLAQDGVAKLDEMQKIIKKLISK